MMGDCTRVYCSLPGSTAHNKLPCPDAIMCRGKGKGRSNEKTIFVGNLSWDVDEAIHNPDSPPKPSPDPDPEAQPSGPLARASVYDVLCHTRRRHCMHAYDSETKMKGIHAYDSDRLVCRSACSSCYSLPLFTVLCRLLSVYRVLFTVSCILDTGPCRMRSRSFSRRSEQ